MTTIIALSFNSIFFASITNFTYLKALSATIIVAYANGLHEGFIKDNPIANKEAIGNNKFIFLILCISLGVNSLIKFFSVA